MVLELKTKTTFIFNALRKFEHHYFCLQTFPRKFSDLIKITKLLGKMETHIDRILNTIAEPKNRTELLLRVFHQ